jgi:hypothetical protein
MKFTHILLLAMVAASVLAVPVIETDKTTLTRKAAEVERANVVLESNKLREGCETEPPALQQQERDCSAEFWDCIFKKTFRRCTYARRTCAHANFALRKLKQELKGRPRQPCVATVHNTGSVTLGYTTDPPEMHLSILDAIKTEIGAVVTPSPSAQTLSPSKSPTEVPTTLPTNEPSSDPTASPTVRMQVCACARVQ